MWTYVEQSQSQGLVLRHMRSYQSSRVRVRVCLPQQQLLLVERNYNNISFFRGFSAVMSVNHPTGKR
jgi:hypothetical protein